ncbi:DUF2635 domain-containing protein [Derxia gummosa]|uniref:DUF2635 domain-containing protein n=1 Tax=Derxia gummosa DSM 723 TaxID=1121388 RepID=A0A8B6X316_9BURK|nr:DUF2635 domain-containing protein [Derxia gummosa]
MPLYIPGAGRTVPDPERGGVVPPEGRDINADASYWARRIADGDLVLPSATDAAAVEPDAAPATDTESAQ